jgi:hypothetical protein
VYVTAPPADPHRLFVVEQTGTIALIRDGTRLTTPFLDITARIQSGGERGLLSMAFAPDYATSGKFYVYYTAPRPSDAGGSIITVDEFTHTAGDLDTADPASRRNVFTVDHPTNSNHNGGQLQFGPDNLLYAGTGDGGSGNDPPNNAQNLSSLLGKLLRVNAADPSAVPEIVAYGLRNPFRFSFDRSTGDLVIGDVGQSAREEVDFAPRGTITPPVNYGWRCFEGSIPTPGITGCSAPNAVAPVLEKNHTATGSGGDGYCAIIGGYVVRDPALTGLAGRYLYTDLCNTELRSAALANPTVTDDVATGLTVPGSVTSFGEDSCGHLYVTASSNAYRIDDAAFTACPEPPPVTDSNPGGGEPPPTGGEPPPQAGLPVDSRAPIVRMSALRRQPTLRLRAFRLAMSCDELCEATAGGAVRIAGSKRVYALAPVTRQLSVLKRRRVNLRVSRRTLKAIRAALKRGKRVTATLTVTGHDAAGNVGTATRRVRSKR